MGVLQRLQRCWRGRRGALLLVATAGRVVLGCKMESAGCRKESRGRGFVVSGGALLLVATAGRVVLGCRTEGVGCREESRW